MLEPKENHLFNWLLEDACVLQARKSHDLSEFGAISNSICFVALAYRLAYLFYLKMTTGGKIFSASWAGKDVDR